jgi:oxaloacetate decarboxylase beta subunit
MTWDAVANIFQGVTTLADAFSNNPKMAIARIGLIGLGLLLVYMGKKGYLEALLMIPMGLGMATVNAAIMFFDPLKLHGGTGTLFVEAQAGATADAVKRH